MKSVSFEKIASALDVSVPSDGRRSGGRVFVSGVCVHSARVSPGDIFVAIKGAAADGHNHLAEAVSRGAAAVITERNVNVPGVCAAVVKNSAEAAAKAAGVFYGFPSRSFALAGVTGTNGKTTVCHLLRSVWRHGGKTAGIIGTVEISCGDFSAVPSMTTPDATELQEIFSLMRAQGAERVCMEVSSHAISQQRAAACDFDAAVFTNLSPDHLDYHGDMRRYGQTKKRLFTELLSQSVKREKFSILNFDDPTGREIARSAAGQVVGYSAEDSSAEVFAEKFSLGAGGINALVRTPWGKMEISSSLIGDYNVSNILAASAAALCLGSSTGDVSRALSSPIFVPGRMERVGAADVFVDYAHTPDALARALAALRPLCRGRLFAVFGCGGDRDKSKRPLMGRIASRGADVIVLTSDNPRSEDPARILEEIESGVVPSGCDAVKIVSRREAIGHAIFSAREGDLVLIAGKGHEKYQIINGEKIPFDDKTCAADFLKEKGAAR